MVRHMTFSPRHHGPLGGQLAEAAVPSFPALHGTDEPVVELLRGDAALSIPELSEALGVTATAVRQRLSRLMDAGVVVRERRSHPGQAGRGRPSHVYQLSETGRRLGGDNFRDLAMVLWKEIRSVEEPAVRRGLLARIGRSLAEACKAKAGGFQGVGSPAGRMAMVAVSLQERQIACECTAGRGTGGAGEPLAVLTTHTCPYPQLAEADRGICAAERVMLEELVEAPVRLAECRLDGDSCCRFTVEPKRQRPLSVSRPRKKEA
jgi:DeoR family suf operon transcriptional repressor